ncbi:hypothetical protein P691DRAFT_412492 [Macrolepiota fuliginosa MF-IS2]|uniref:Uncharacterized protein n=1 Tax=Macrolepiota fuliginosa MF-IS2 TaxID=1400762 RepID=A0A9P5XHK6_9AGAR|nr:hypothetical protein P691DRAFT_412492 [Macrolepiota fuliginosa MF-IS2]
MKPPSMVLDEDINGFRATQKKRHVGKGKHKKNKNAPVVPTWDPSEPYDPLRANDYNEYKIWKQKDRIERRERLIEERRMEERKRMRRGGAYSDSDGTHSEDERPPRKAGRYEEHYDRWSRKDDVRDLEHDDDKAMDITPVAVDRDLTGDEAYQRRLAMSKGFQPPSPPPTLEPQQQQQPDVTTQGTDIPGIGRAPLHPAPKDETGEEAYLRRLAMSTMNVNRQAQPQPQRPPSPPPPRSPSPPSLSFNPFAPPSVPPPPPPGSAFGAVGGGMPGLNDIEEKKKAAAAIAAKLGALAALAPPPSTSAPAVESSMSPSTVIPPSTEEKRYAP